MAPDIGSLAIADIKRNGGGIELEILSTLYRGVGVGVGDGVVVTMGLAVVLVDKGLTATMNSVVGELIAM
jgi:hypothetical protein